MLRKGKANTLFWMAQWILYYRHVKSLNGQLLVTNCDLVGILQQDQIWLATLSRGGKTITKEIVRI